jgi:LCP family protein required for cell wall assembly
MLLKNNHLLRTWLPRLFLLAFLLSGTVTIGLGAYVLVHQVTLSDPLGRVGQALTIQTPQATSQSDGVGNLSPPPPTAQVGINSPPVGEPSLTPWDGAGRVTVLLLGLDYRDWSQGSDASRSDTMILLSLDPLTRTAGILSIPRDTWVEIPGWSHAKINTAFYLGDAHKLPGGGPGLAVKTVEEFLGVPVNYYAVIDFAAFVRFIDEIGGVKIDVPEEITVDLLGDGSSTIKKLKPGVQVLPGEWALAYARNRKTASGDFDRARRQQQVILAIRDRVLDFDLLPTLIQKAPDLYQEISSGIRTNLPLDDAIKLALLAKEVPQENIKQGVLGKGYMVFGRSPDNLSINIPIPDKVSLLRDEIFSTSGAVGPLTPGSTQQQMAAEGAKLAVYNGSRVSDLGRRTAEYLSKQGAQVVQVDDADQAYAATTLIDHTGSPYLLKYLTDLLGVNGSRIKLDYNPDSPVDVELYLGYDAEATSQLTQ